jgi:hypothetical protein
MVPQKKRDIQLQLYTTPSFEPFATWTIYSSEAGKHRFRRVRWDSVVDRALEIGSPTTFGADAWIEADVIAGYLGELSGMMLSPFRMPDRFGVDGVTFGVRRWTFGFFAEVSWWCEPAPGNEMLSDWYHRFVDELEFRLPGATDPMPEEEIPR